MNKIDLNNKWWYRLLQVFYVFLFIACASAIIIIFNMFPYKEVNYNSYVLCKNYEVLHLVEFDGDIDFTDKDSVNKNSDSINSYCDRRKRLNDVRHSGENTNNLREAFKHALQNPDSDFAKELTKLAESGFLDSDAKNLDVNLSPLMSKYTSDFKISSYEKFDVYILYNNATLFHNPFTFSLIYLLVLLFLFWLIRRIFLYIIIKDSFKQI